ncbi:hypothetical protein HWD99_12100 [Microbacterium sp. C5A9]|uniref:pilus assembly protein TadG-related protein n=1 Tax=Microbacterium sp. C5A9 TaxID=2736663 RepID=UPI001F52264C|nr:pilus assembly protein TadG-related protein [Microbacterium sp. C5A9]MCI1019370.1 hypothetical protein [Microbacterium sp. C5A9]
MSGRGRYDDDGSVLLLTLGYALLALTFVCVCATDLYLAQKRLDSLADAAALAGADGFTLVVDGSHALAELSDPQVQEQAAAVIEVASETVTLVSATASENLTARVTITAPWHPPLLSLFVPDGVELRATATSRTAVR